MSTLTQKLVSSRSMTLIGDISKDYPSVEAVKDLHVFSTVSLFSFHAQQPVITALSQVLRALNLSLLYESKTIGSDKFRSTLKGLKDKFALKSCNGDPSPEGIPPLFPLTLPNLYNFPASASPHKAAANIDSNNKTNGSSKSKSHELRTEDMTNKINDCMNSILNLLDASK